MWPFAMVNDKWCSEVEVFQISDLRDPEENDLQNLTIIVLSKDTSLKIQSAFYVSDRQTDSTDKRRVFYGGNQSAIW